MSEADTHYDVALRKFKAWSLTFRPRNGVTDEQIKILCDNIRKRSVHYMMITEKQEEKRHFHSGFILKNAQAKKNLKRWILDPFKSQLDPMEEKVQSQGIKIMYNGDWVTEYLTKEDDTVVLDSKFPLDMQTIDVYFPPTIQNEKKLVKANVADWWYAKMEKLWYEYYNGVEPSTVNIFNFFIDMMHNKRVIRVIENKRKLIEKSIALKHHIKKSTLYEGQILSEIGFLE